MSAAGENYEHAIWLFYDPDAIGVQETLVNAERKIRGVADAENSIRFVQRAGKEKAEEHQEVDAEISPDTGPNYATTAPVDIFDRFFVGRGGCFGFRCGGSSRRGRCLCYLALGLICHSRAE